MSDIKLSGQTALKAHTGMGLYVCPNDDEGLNSLYYTIEVNDAQGVQLLQGHPHAQAVDPEGLSKFCFRRDLVPRLPHPVCDVLLDRSAHLIHNGDS